MMLAVWVLGIFTDQKNNRVLSFGCITISSVYNVCGLNLQ